MASSSPPDEQSVMSMFQGDRRRQKRFFDRLASRMDRRRKYDDGRSAVVSNAAESDLYSHTATFVETLCVWIKDLYKEIREGTKDDGDEWSRVLDQLVKSNPESEIKYIAENVNPCVDEIYRVVVAQYMRRMNRSGIEYPSLSDFLSKFLAVFVRNEEVRDREKLVRVKSIVESNVRATLMQFLRKDTASVRRRSSRIDEGPRPDDSASCCFNEDDMTSTLLKLTSSKKRESAPPKRIFGGVRNADPSVLSRRPSEAASRRSQLRREIPSRSRRREVDRTEQKRDATSVAPSRSRRREVSRTEEKKKDASPPAPSRSRRREVDRTEEKKKRDASPPAPSRSRRARSDGASIQVSLRSRYKRDRREESGTSNDENRTVCTRLKSEACENDKRRDEDRGNRKN